MPEEYVPINNHSYDICLRVGYSKVYFRNLSHVAVMEFLPLIDCLYCLDFEGKEFIPTVELISNNRNVDDQKDADDGN